MGDAAKQLGGVAAEEESADSSAHSDVRAAEETAAQPQPQRDGRPGLPMLRRQASTGASLAAAVAAAAGTVVVPLSSGDAARPEARPRARKLKYTRAHSVATDASDSAVGGTPSVVSGGSSAAHEAREAQAALRRAAARAASVRASRPSPLPPRARSPSAGGDGAFDALGSGSGGGDGRSGSRRGGSRGRSRGAGTPGQIRALSRQSSRRAGSALQSRGSMSSWASAGSVEAEEEDEAPAELLTVEIKKAMQRTASWLVPVLE